MRKLQWINPENFADRCAELFEIHGLKIPENIYKEIHAFMMGFNKCNNLTPPILRSQCERIRIDQEDSL